MLVAPDYTSKSNVSHHSFEAYQEFLLDRIAANFVSFTILEDEELLEMSTSASDK